MGQTDSSLAAANEAMAAGASSVSNAGPGYTTLSSLLSLTPAHKTSHRPSTTSTTDTMSSTISVSPVPLVFGSTTANIMPTTGPNVVVSILSAALSADENATSTRLQPGTVLTAPTAYFGPGTAVYPSVVTITTSSDHTFETTELSTVLVTTTFDTSTFVTSIRRPLASSASFPSPGTCIEGQCAPLFTSTAVPFRPSVALTWPIAVNASAVSSQQASDPTAVTTVIAPIGGSSTSIRVQSGSQPASALSTMSMEAAQSALTPKGPMTSLSSFVFPSSATLSAQIASSHTTGAAGFNRTHPNPPAGTGVFEDPASGAESSMQSLEALIELLDQSVDFQVNVEYHIVDRSGNLISGTYTESKDGSYGFGDQQPKYANGTHSVAGGMHGTTPSLPGRASRSRSMSTGLVQTCKPSN